MEHVLILTLTIAYQEDGWKKKFSKDPAKCKFYPKFSLLHKAFLLHSLVSQEMCLRSPHYSILC